VVWLRPVSPTDKESTSIADLCSLIKEVTEVTEKGASNEVRDLVSNNKRYKMRVTKVNTLNKDEVGHVNGAVIKTDATTVVDVGSPSVHAMEDAPDNASHQAAGSAGDHGDGSHKVGGKAEMVQCFAALLQRDSGLSTRGRRELALRLTAALVRFRRTPWMDGPWTWNNIWVSMGQDDDDHNIVKFSILFIPREFYSTAITDSSSLLTAVEPDPLSNVHELIDNQPILTKLGFALIELAIGKTMEKMQAEYGFDKLPLDNDMVNLMVAKKLLRANRIREEAGQQYEDVVRVCITHEYIDQGGNPVSLMLEHDSFPSSANDAIISPLYGVYREFAREISLTA